MSHAEIHKSHRVGWLRAAVLGANDRQVPGTVYLINLHYVALTHVSYKKALFL